MRNNKYQSEAMQECSALLDWTLELLLCNLNHAGFKIVQDSFCGRFCVPRPSDACQFCFTTALEAALGLELFRSSVEASFLAWL